MKDEEADKQRQERTQRATAKESKRVQNGKISVRASTVWLPMPGASAPPALRRFATPSVASLRSNEAAGDVNGARNSSYDKTCGNVCSGGNGGGGGRTLGEKAGVCAEAGSESAGAGAGSGGGWVAGLSATRRSSSSGHAPPPRPTLGWAHLSRGAPLRGLSQVRTGSRRSERHWAAWSKNRSRNGSAARVRGNGGGGCPGPTAASATPPAKGAAEAAAPLAAAKLPTLPPAAALRRRPGASAAGTTSRRG